MQTHSLISKFSSPHITGAKTVLLFPNAPCTHQRTDKPSKKRRNRPFGNYSNVKLSVQITLIWHRAGNKWHLRRDKIKRSVSEKWKRRRPFFINALRDPGRIAHTKKITPSQKFDVCAAHCFLLYLYIPAWASACVSTDRNPSHAESLIGTTYLHSRGSGW